MALSSAIVVSKFYKNLILKNKVVFNYCKVTSPKCFISASSNVEACYKDKDPAPLFFNQESQKIMEDLTGFDIEKIFKGSILEDSTSLKENYKFVNVEDIEKIKEENIKNTKLLLQMPPIVKEREAIDEIISEDFALEGLLKHEIVFTDISPDISNKERIIVTRKIDGTLQHASWDQRQRMNQIYNPTLGRYLKTPPLFVEGDLLKDCLNRFEYNYILDFACAQFEPDDPLYQNVVSDTYDHIDLNSNYQLLESTRHFGPMCFYFAWNHKIDNLLLFYISNNRISDSVNLIKLRYLIQSDGSRKDCVDEDKTLEYIKNYIDNESKSGTSALKIAYQTYKETSETNRQVKMDEKAAHGI